MIKAFKDNAVPKARAEKMTAEELKGKFVIGGLYRSDKTEFCDEYQKVVDAHLVK
jgi:2-oxoglutarate ferredoxin oxidoreductase subunit beta